MPHVERRSRNGVIDYRARYADPSGRMRSRSFAKKRDAEAFLIAEESKKQRQEWTDPALGKTLCGDYIEDWLATKADVGLQAAFDVLE